MYSPKTGNADKPLLIDKAVRLLPSKSFPAPGSEVIAVINAVVVIGEVVVVVVIFVVIVVIVVVVIVVVKRVRGTRGFALDP